MRLAIAVVCGLVLPAAAAAAPHRLGDVRRYLDKREGIVGVAVADPHGIVGVRSRRVFDSASVVKAMLLVGYLQKLDREGRALTDDDDEQLRPMITESANDQATWVYNQLGNAGLERLAADARMRQFTITGTSWSSARFSARDQAKFFWRIEALLPDQFRDYAMGLLSSVIPSQSWGIARVARNRGYSPFFKGGWGGGLVSQAALLDGFGAVAVLTDRNPKMSYGIATIRGVARRVIP